MELGLTTFAEITDPGVSPGERLRQVVEEAKLADELGLEVYGIGEHHRPDMAASAPEIVLATIAGCTKTIKLSSAVIVLSSADPVRVFQNFVTLDLLSNRRAELMVGRGSFTESFPLFGYSLSDYDELFAEKLDLLLKLRAGQAVTWQGKFRPLLDNAMVYPRQEDRPLPIWIAVGGTPNSVVRPVPSACRWHSRSSAAVQRPSHRWSSSTARLLSTQNMTSARHLQCTATVMSSPTSGRHGRSSCRLTARPSPKSAESEVGRRCRMRLSRN